ncbi:MAG: hypothetical protein LBN21_01805 [Treponema sp.]|jgi:hypothetical protein|nr:hypothetical protein [Treponema sp.]
MQKSLWALRKISARKSAGVFALVLLCAAAVTGTQESPGGILMPDMTGDTMSDMLGDIDPDEPSAPPLPPPRWFRSNAGGMTIAEVPSRLAALRNEYALVIDYRLPEDLPENLTPYYEADYRIEIRILFEGGAESRRQWIFQDADGTIRLAAVFIPVSIDDDVVDGEVIESEAVDTETVNSETAAGESAAPERRYPTGFIGIYGSDGLITAEHQFFADGEETITDYSYRNQFLLRSEGRRRITNEDGETVTAKTFADSYRYNRAGGLRTVERFFYSESGASAPPVRIAFPHLILDAAQDTNFVSPGLAYGTEFLDDIFMGEGYTAVYTIDDRGRILTETRQDDEGEVIGELRNTWAGERLSQVSWKEGEDEKITEYEYDDKGDRILERNFHNGELERVVRIQGKGEVEELYMNGNVILRALWDDGRKISEERVRK